MNDIKVPPFTDGQKQIIKMTEKLAEKRGGKICDVDGIGDDIKDVKELLEDTIQKVELQAEPQPTEDYLPINCYVCNGSGWIAGNSHRHVQKCGRCNGTGRINYKTLTNYEKIKMASEKELAEFLENGGFSIQVSVCGSGSHSCSKAGRTCLRGNRTMESAV